jgi:hypothetical protein
LVYFRAKDKPYTEFLVLIGFYNYPERNYTAQLTKPIDRNEERRSGLKDRKA